MPFALSRPASSSAFAASPTDTISGRCRSIWPDQFVEVAARSQRHHAQIAPGSASTTDRHCLPIEPVDPKMANFVKAGVTIPFSSDFSVDREMLAG